MTTRVIVTAAHCLKYLSPTHAMAGVTRKDGTEMELPILASPRRMFVPASDPDTLDDRDDIALLFVGGNEVIWDKHFSFERELANALFRRPGLARRSGDVGTATFDGGTNEPVRRRVVWNDILAVDGTWRSPTRTDGKTAYVSKGESGAGLFAFQPDGSREISAC